MQPLRLVFAAARRRAVLLVLAMLPLLASCDVLNVVNFNNSPPGKTTTIILIRHAERDPGTDPPLNAEGVVRANALIEVLKENGVTAIYSPDVLRNRQTVDPLAAHLGITVKGWTPALYANTTLFADAVVEDILANQAGGTVLFVGNVGSQIFGGTPGINAEIYKRLGGTGRAPERYQDMYIINVPETGPARFIKTIYGAKSSLDPAI